MGSAVQSDRRTDQVVGEIDWGAAHETDKTGHFALIVVGNQDERHIEHS